MSEPLNPDNRHNLLEISHKRDELNQEWAKKKNKLADDLKHSLGRALTLFMILFYITLTAYTLIIMQNDMTENRAYLQKMREPPVLDNCFNALFIDKTEDIGDNQSIRSIAVDLNNSVLDCSMLSSVPTSITCKVTAKQQLDKTTFVWKCNGDHCFSVPMLN